MTARLEQASFHIALLFVIFTACIFTIDSIGGINDFRVQMTLWLSISIVGCSVISFWCHAYSLERWKEIEPHGPSKVILCGHLGLMVGGWLLFEMIKIGAGSGLVLLPAVAWVAICYLAGLLEVIYKLNVRHDNRANNLPNS